MQEVLAELRPVWLHGKNKFSEPLLFRLEHIQAQYASTMNDLIDLESDLADKISKLETNAVCLQPYQFNLRQLQAVVLPHADDIAAALCSARGRDALVVRLATLLKVLSSPEMLVFTAAFFQAIDRYDLGRELAPHMPIAIDYFLVHEAVMDFVPLLEQIYHGR